MYEFRPMTADDLPLVKRWLAMRDRWPEVVEELERAHQQNPTHPDITRMLDEARRHAGATTAPISP